jgi:hypothetical protein
VNDDDRRTHDPGSGVPIVAEQVPGQLAAFDGCCECDDRWQPCSCLCHA